MMKLLRTCTVVPLAMSTVVALSACVASSPRSSAYEASQATPSISRPAQPDFVERGYLELASGRVEAAEKSFERALAADASSIEARVGLLRSWIAQARINDSLDVIDQLAVTAFPRAEIDYLYGMAFARKARVFIQQDVPLESIQMAYADAATALLKATRAAPDAHKDAYAPLAEATWYLQDLDAARTAADRAVVLLPADPEGFFVLGKVALAQYVEMQASAGEAQASEGEVEESEGEAQDGDGESQEGDGEVQETEEEPDAAPSSAIADSHWHAARSAFTMAVQLLSQPHVDDAAALDLKVRAQVELGNTLAWKRELVDAALAYASAMETAPSKVQFERVHATLGADLFANAVGEGLQRYAAREPALPAEKALLLWWLGYARFEQMKYAEAEAAFVAAVELAPAYVNSWFYTALARYQQKNLGGATSAFLRNWSESAESLIAAVQTNLGFNIPVLDALVGWCVEQERTLDAAVLSEIQAQSQPELMRYWNNTGLFYRDVGEALVRSGLAADIELAQEHFERAYTAYSNALARSPEDPAILNDTGVMLHYCLKRDFAQAKLLYEKANEFAKRELARSDLDEDTRELYRIALRDSGNNLKLLAQDQRKMPEGGGAK